MSFKAVQLSNPCRSIYSLEELCVCVCVCVRPFYFYFLRIVKEEETVLHGGDYMEGEVKATHHVTIPRPFSSSFFGIQPLRLLSSVTTSPVTHTHTQNFNTHTPNETKSQCITRMRRLRFIGLRVAVVASRRLQHRKKFIRTRLVLLVCV